MTTGDPLPTGLVPADEHPLAGVADDRPGGAPTPLDDVVDELTSDERTEPFITLDVPERPGWAVRYANTLTFDEWREWQKPAKEGRGPDADYNPLIFAAIIAANKCDAILRRGVEVADEDTGGPLTFKSPRFVRLYVKADAPNARRQAITRFYKVDGHLIAASRRLVRELGIVDELDDSGGGGDPT